MQAQDVELTIQHPDLWQRQVPDEPVSGQPRYRPPELLYTIGQGILDGTVETLGVVFETTEESINDFAVARAIWGVLARRTQKKQIRAQIAKGKEKLNLVADLLGDTTRQEVLQRVGIFEPLRDTYKHLFRTGFKLEAQLRQNKFYNLTGKYTLFKSTLTWVRDASVHEEDEKSAWVMIGLALHEGEIPMETPRLTPQRAELTSPSDLTLAAPHTVTVIEGESAGLTSGTSVELSMFGRRRSAKAAGGQCSDSDNDDSDDEIDYVFDKEPVPVEAPSRTGCAVDEATRGSGPRIDKGKGRVVDK